MDNALQSKLAKIKLLASDFDGVMTNGKVDVHQDGTETIQCSRRDGMGIAILKKNGVEVCVISSEANPVVRARCDKLKIECYQKVESTEGKKEVLSRIAQEKGLVPEEIAFIGDDVNDLDALGWAGTAFTVADCHPRVKPVAHYITSRNGGDHAVREICDLILEAKQQYLPY